MSNHFHILLEVTPMPEAGISDQVLLERLGMTTSQTFNLEFFKTSFSRNISSQARMSLSPIILPKNHSASYLEKLSGRRGNA